jgi:ribonuclease BN (tRNA processing enzyme)
MKLTVLGSGNADHHGRRAGSGFLLQPPGPIVLDFGPGVWRNLALAGIDPAGLRLILLTHLHADHYADLIPFLFHQYWAARGGGRPPLLILGPPGTREMVTGLRRVVPCLDEHDFSIEVRDMDGGEAEFEGARLSPFPVTHVESMVCLAWRVEHAGRRFVYAGDCCSNALAAKAVEGADLAVVEATYPDDHPHPAHMTAGEACDLAREAGVKRLVLSHLSPRWDGRNPVAECAGRFPGPLYAPDDLAVVEEQASGGHV